jgi:hypothetical protein
VSPPGAAARCDCGALLSTFWLWPDEETENLIHVTDRARDAPRHAEEIKAVSATDAAVAYDRKHEPEHDIIGTAGPIRRGRCRRRSGLRR